MITAIFAALPAMLSFLGGAAARTALGFAIDWLKKKQDHAQEMERMRLQAQLDQQAAERQMQSIRLQAELKVQEVRVAADGAIGLAEAQAFLEAQKVANQPTGIRIIDAWNGAIRPAAASIAIALWCAKIVKAGFVIAAWDENLIASILGYFFADRHMGKRK